MICPRCQESDKPTHKGRRVCKDCFKSDKQDRLASIRKWVQDYKENTPCMDCELFFPFYVIQFDHRPDTEKCGAVSDMVNQENSLKKIVAEIHKCDAVCSNCHAERTYTRRKPPEGLSI